MPKLKEQLIENFTAMPGVTVDRWKDTELLGVNYKGKEVAHFQTGSNNELDIRLTPAIIKHEKLTKAAGTKSHPDRSPNSRWIVMGFPNAKDLGKMMKLVKMAIDIR